MKLNIVILNFIVVGAISLLCSCATIVNDSHIPVDFVFEDGSTGECTFTNKRGSWTCEVPCKGTLIRRSDDDLVYNCTTADGKVLNGSVKSEIEGGKMAASVIFWDLGITDAITDKHRRYQKSVIIPVIEGKSELISEDTSKETSEETPEKQI